MKKLTVVFLITILAAIFLTACMAEEDYSGIWYMREISLGGVTLSLEGLDLEALHKRQYIDLRADGNAELLNNMTDSGIYQSLDGSWSINGKGEIEIQFPGGVMTLIPQDGNLCLQDGDTVQVYGRNDPSTYHTELHTEENQIVPIAGNTAEKEEDFFGIWTSSGEILINGARQEIFSSQQIILTILPGRLSYSVGDRTEDRITLFQDNILSAWVEIAPEEYLLDFTLALFEDGSLGWSTNQEGMPINLYRKNAQ
ncbi:MAG: hypothetical protein IKE15_04160 [Clostridia bacterium]|nr:hypothetical protein [Clostridia bacterium]